MLRVHAPRGTAHRPLPPGVTRQNGVLLVKKPNERVLEALLEWFADVYAGTLPRNAPPAWCIARYRRERRKAHNNVEDWKSPQQLLRDGYGDCEDLVIYELVRLRQNGTRRRAKVVRTRRRRYHALYVLIARRLVLDPSRAAVAARRALYRKDLSP